MLMLTGFPPSRTWAGVSRLPSPMGAGWGNTSASSGTGEIVLRSPEDLRLGVRPAPLPWGRCAPAGRWEPVQTPPEHLSHDQNGVVTPARHLSHDQNGAATQARHLSHDQNGAATQARRDVQRSTSVLAENRWHSGRAKGDVCEHARLSGRATGKIRDKPRQSGRATRGARGTQRLSDRAKTPLGLEGASEWRTALRSYALVILSCPARVS